MAPFLEVRSHIVSILPNVLAMVTILVTGLAAAFILRKLLLRFLSFVRLHHPIVRLLPSDRNIRFASPNAGISDGLSSAG